MPLMCVLAKNILKRNIHKKEIKMNLINALETRYSTKAFDSHKIIPEEIWSQVEAALRLSPSSTNAQPWHFIIASTTEGKKRLTKGTEGLYAFNSQKILDASHVVLFCSRTDMDEDFLHHILEKEDKDGRYATPELKEMMDGGRKMFVNLHINEFKDLPHWLEKQVYLNIGNSLLSAAVLGLDALPMEGIDIEVLNKEFNLKEQKLTAVAAVSFGYKTEDDFNAKIPKSRLEMTDLVTRI